MSGYYFFRSKTPTPVNLAKFLSHRGWSSTWMPWRAQVKDDWLEFPSVISETLEFKHLFATFCQQQGLQDLIPQTFCLDDQSWPDILDQVSCEAWGKFILKPSLLNNGQHIHIFNRIESLYHYFLHGKRMGGPHVLQHYIDPPHLIQGPSEGHKYSIRQLMVLSTHAGCALFPQGYLNISLKPYSSSDPELAGHLTNEHLNHQKMNVAQRLSHEMAVYQPYEDKIVLICQWICDALKRKFPKQWQDKHPRIGCFGVDFMVDANERLWLLEVNHGPCFPTDTSHPLYQKLYAPFWEAVIDHFIEGKHSCMIEL